VAAQPEQIERYTAGEPARVPLARRPMRPGDWLYLVLQILLVAAVELTDDLAHALIPHANRAAGLANALRVSSFESAHGLWVEPGIQSYFAQSHHLLGLPLGWDQVSMVVNALYGQGHVLFTVIFAVWVFVRRPELFTFLRNIFLLTNAVAVLLYEIYPLAPPRLTMGLLYQQRPYHFLDSVFGGGGVKLGFNQYAAMPSVHVAWALIVGLTVAWAARPLAARLLGLAYPVLMTLAVIISGNHYVLDALGAVVVVSLAAALSVLYAWWQLEAASLSAVMGRLALQR